MLKKYIFWNKRKQGRKANKYRRRVSNIAARTKQNDAVFDCFYRIILVPTIPTCYRLVHASIVEVGYSYLNKTKKPLVVSFLNTLSGQTATAQCGARRGNGVSSGFLTILCILEYFAFQLPALYDLQACYLQLQHDFVARRNLGMVKLTQVVYPFCLPKIQKIKHSDHSIVLREEYTHMLTT